MILTLLLGFLQLVQQDLPAPQVIDTQNGLSNNIVYGTYQDREGFIWIATNNGLNRFDGYSFKTFYHNPKDSTSISSNIVRTVLEDPNGRLWVGTFNGLNLYNPKTASFTRFTDPIDLANIRLDIQQMALDSHGTIWLNTLRTIGAFDTKKFEFSFIDSLYSASNMALDNQDRVWLSSQNGTLDEFKPKENKLINLREANNKDKQPLYWGKYSKSLWIKDVAFKDAFDTKTSVLPKLPNDTFARNLLEVDEHTLWIGTEIGLFIYHTITDKLERVKLGNSSTLSSAIRSIYKDNNGGVWVGTLGGLFHFDSFQKPFEHLDLIPASGDVIMGLETTSGIIYANALGKGLYSYDTKSHTIKAKTFAKVPPDGYNFIWSVASIPESNYPLWLATDAGLLLYNPDTGNWKDMKLTFATNKRSPSFSIFVTGSDSVWVSDQESVHLLSKKDDSIKKSISLFEYTNGSIIQDITQIGNQLFIATEGVGTLVHNFNSKKTQALSELIPEAENLSSTPTWELFKDGEILWFGTNIGLFRLDTDTKAFTQIVADATLKNRIIFSIEKDQHGILWMGTERGLMSYNPQNEAVHAYTENDGLKNVEYNRKSVKKTSDGKLLFGGVNGITSFHPDQIQQNSIIPPVYITGIQIITSDSTFTPTRKNSEKLSLPWYHNTLQIDYVALNYTNSAQNQYRHQLVGHDPGWVENKGARQARYVRLPPGAYTFKLMGSNNDGLWNDQAKSIIITITPPFWQTLWFRLLVILLLSAIGYTLYKYRVKKLLEVERVRLRIAGDLHDEVGSGLSGIALTGDLLQRQVKNGGAKPELVERITKNARNLASSLDAIVWLIDPQKETLGDFIIKTRAVGSELLTQSKFELIEALSETDRSRSLSAEQKRNLFLLTKEGLHNISKHALADKVILTIRYEQSILSIRLIDNGNGFDLKQNEKGHGLGSMKNRANLLKGELKLNSTIGKGTEISLRMKLP